MSAEQQEKKFSPVGKAENLNRKNYFWHRISKKCHRHQQLCEMKNYQQLCHRVRRRRWKIRRKISRVVKGNRFPQRWRRLDEDLLGKSCLCVLGPSNAISAKSTQICGRRRLGLSLISSNNDVINCRWVMLPMFATPSRRILGEWSIAGLGKNVLWEFGSDVGQEKSLMND